MFARLNYVDVKPDRFVDMDPYWQETVAAYGRILVRGWFLQLGSSTTTLSLVFFTDEQAARDNTRSHLGAAAAQAAAFRLSEPVVSLAAVLGTALPAESNRPATARISSLDVTPSARPPAAAHWLAVAGHWRHQEGFCGAALLDDRSRDRLCSVQFWQATGGSNVETPAGETSGCMDSDRSPWPGSGGELWRIRVDVGALEFPELASS